MGKIMSKPFLAGVVLCALSTSQAADAQHRVTARKAPVVSATAPPKAEPAACAGLMSDYDNISKQMAIRQADEVLDNSAARATMRETQNASGISQASMTLDIMKAKGCTLPDFVPSASRYGLASLICANKRQEIRKNRAWTDYPIGLSSMMIRLSVTPANGVPNNL